MTQTSNKFLIIDFDSTFVTVEALDELAKISLNERPDKDSLVEEISTITSLGMESKIPLKESLNRRLALLSANRAHIDALVDVLLNNITPSFLRNKAFFRSNAEKIYIVSGGFKEYIIPVVSTLGILPEHVFANTFQYDAQGNIIGFDVKNVLSADDGKVHVVSGLNLPGKILVIGDGMTDYAIRDAKVAHQFYGFIENIRREPVVEKADVVISNFDEFLFLHDLPRALSYPRNRIKVLLLENVHSTAIKSLKQTGFSVECIKGSLSEDELCKAIEGVSILGIRSKTLVSAKVLEHANNLIAIGAFCIGTNQIDLAAATKQGVCVFNAPYSNTRSVVELVIGEIIMLMRHVVGKSVQLHQGIWDKNAVNCHEVRDKTLGIIGYGNIGSQLSVLAESLGMRVVYFDVAEKLQLGNAKKCETLEELLSVSDIVTLHVDGRESNTHLIGAAHFAMMKDDAIFLNLSRGHVVNIDALVDALKSKKLLGAAVDVFPYEPKSNDESFQSPLQQFDNVILTPHIGGSTEEAQFHIGAFVSKQITNYVNAGDSTQSVNLPRIQLPALHHAHRVIHLHNNVPGILAQINAIFARNQINILGQYLKTNEQVGYVISDIDTQYDKAVLIELKKIPGTIHSRVLY